MEPAISRTADDKYWQVTSPHSVAIMQLRFTSFAVINLRWGFHLQECAHAGRIKKKGVRFSSNPLI